MRTGTFGLGVLWCTLQACNCGPVAEPLPPGANAIACTCRCGASFGGDSVVCSVDPFRSDAQCNLPPVLACIPPDIGSNPLLEGDDLSEEQRKEVCSRVCEQTPRALIQNISGLRLEVRDAGPNPSEVCDVVCVGIVGAQSPDGGFLGGAAVDFTDPSCVDDAGVRPECGAVECPSVREFSNFEELEAALAECTVVSENIGGCAAPTRPTDPACAVERLDPPLVTPNGLVSFLTGDVSLASIDPALSSVLVTANGGPEEGVSGAVSGWVGVVGQPCADGTCDVGVYVVASVDDLALSFTIAGVPGSVELKDLAVTARSAPGAIALVDGAAALSGANVFGTARTHAVPGVPGFSAQDIAFAVWPTDSVDVRVDFATGEYRIRGAFESAESIDPPRPALSASFTLRGRLLAQPPIARAGPDAVVECSQESGVTLDGSMSSDADGDIASALWLRGDGTAVGDALVAETDQDLGTETYALVVADRQQRQSVDSVVVEVTDTTPPVIEYFENRGPACLAPPNHKYVVLRVGEELSGLVTDACDPAPALVITGAASSQVDDGSGDGATERDVVVFPDRVCLRAERAGTDPEARTYRISVVARDQSGNESDPVIDVTVAHDQRDHDCSRIEASLFVDDDSDPLCNPAANVAPPSTQSSPDFVEAESAGSCASAGAMPAFLSLIALLFFRRRSLASLSILSLAACSAPVPAGAQLDECIRDVWYQAPSPCGCLPSEAQPECDASDCQLSSFRWFREGNDVVDGFILASAETGTFSTSGAPIAQAWAVHGRSLTIGPRDDVARAQTLPVERCDAEQLVWGPSLRHRARRGDSALFEASFQDGGWTAAPFTP